LVILCIIVMPIQSLDKIHKRHKSHLKLKTNARISNGMKFKLHHHANHHASHHASHHAKIENKMREDGDGGEISADNAEIAGGEQMINEGEQLESQGEQMVDQGVSDVEHTEGEDPTEGEAPTDVPAGDELGDQVVDGAGDANANAGGFRNCQNSRTIQPIVQSNDFRCWAATGAMFKTAMGTPTTEQQFVDAYVAAGGRIVPSGRDKDAMFVSAQNDAIYATVAGAIDVVQSITFQMLCDWLTRGPLIQDYQTGQTLSHVVLITRAQGTNDDDFQIGFIDPHDGQEQVKSMADFRSQYSDAQFGKLFRAP